MKKPKLFNVLMNALLKVSRKWLVAVFCFFVSMTCVFAQEIGSTDGSKPIYKQASDGKYYWYAFFDSTRFHERAAFLKEYDLTKCYKPFNEFSIDMVFLRNPDGTFVSNAYVRMFIDETMVWEAHTTGSTTGSGDVMKGQPMNGILKGKSDGAGQVVKYGVRFARRNEKENGVYKWKSHDPRYSKTNWVRNDSRWTEKDASNFYYTDVDPYYGYYCSRYVVDNEPNPARYHRHDYTSDTKDNDDYVDDAMKLWGNDFYTTFSVNCMDKGIGLNPNVIKVQKTAKSQIARMVYSNLSIKLAHHLVFADKDGKLITEKTDTIVATQKNVYSDNYYLPVRSFLLDGGWNMRIVAADDDNLPGTTNPRIEGGVEYGHSTLPSFGAFQIEVNKDPFSADGRYVGVTSNDVQHLLTKANPNDPDFCAFVGAEYKADSCPAFDPTKFIRVRFKADTTCTRKAIFKIWDSSWYDDNGNPITVPGRIDDGMPHMVTFNLFGQYLKPAELKWLANDNIIENNGTLDVVYGHGAMSTGTLALSAYPYKDSERDTRLQQGQTACPSNGAIKYCLIDNNEEECFSYNGVTIDPATGSLTATDVTAGLTSKEDLDDAKKVLTVTVKAIIAATTECKADTSYIIVNVHPKHVILTETTLNTAMCEYDLVKNGHVITNYDSPIVCYCNFETDGTVCGSYGATANAVNLHHVGKILVSAESKDSEHGDAALDYTEFTVERGTLYFESDGDWKTGAWTSKEGVNAPVIYNTIATVPLGKNHDAVINAACSVSTNNSTSGSLVEGTSNWANNLTISSTGSLTINSTGCAMVEGTLTNNAGSAKLSIKADESNQGSLIFADGIPAGNVDVVCRGTNSDADPIWQYRGIPVASATVTVPSGSYIYEWSEALLENPLGWGYEHWKNSNGSLSAWKGYAFGRLNSADEYYIYNVSGTLLCADKSVTLDYTTTNNSNNKGQNLITNSYNAAVAVSELKTEDFHNTEATLFIYNQGTYNDYKDNWDGSESSVTGDESAKVTVYPIFSGADATGAEISVIPSGQSFFLRALGTGASFDFRHETLKPENAGAALRAPRRSEDFNVLEINVEGGNQKDRVVLMENDNCSRGFDNGYDGSKFLSSDMAQIYATNDFGKTEINCDAVLAGNYIGFAAARNGVKYTISFDTDRLEGYSRLFLYDTQNGRYIDILAGETYEFTGKHSGEDRRFILMGEREDGSSFTGSERRIEVIGDNFVVCGFDGMDVPVVISDMSGRTWWQGTTADGALFNLPSLPKGVYVISVDKCNVKFAK